MNIKILRKLVESDKFINVFIILMILILYVYVVFFYSCTELELNKSPSGLYCVSEYNYKIDKICYYYNMSSNKYEFYEYDNDLECNNSDHEYNDKIK